ncbi:MAG: sodium:solute symporter family protein [Sulfolobales archaeon]|nr:sodium:solute symporter family protein [Sulfolobales archaeon]MCX8208448.1 sodium:solute symporter family protein [Sulfolobales archaeon]MDW8010424.1 sodium:solute symporter family protein [Sulfolobales archaeon]
MPATVDAAIFVAYLVALVAIGYITTKMARGFEDFSVAGRRLKLWLAFSTVAATWIGGGITIGVAARAYAGRMIGAWGTTIGFGSTLVLLGLFYAGPLRRLRLHTLADYYSERFGRPWLGGLSGLIMYVAYVFAVTAQVVAGAVLLSTVFEWDYATSTIVSGGVVVAYTVMGGLWAVALTDFVQLILIFAGILAAIAIGVGYVGLGRLSVLLGEAGAFDPRILLSINFWALFLVLSLGDIPAPDLVQRVYASKDDRTAGYSSILAGISYYLAGLTSVVVGVVMKYLEPDLPDPNLAYPTMVKYFLPVGISGLVLSGLMAAIMSNADSMLLAPSIVLAKNIIKDLIRRDMSEAELLKITRYAIVVLGVLAIGAGLARADVLYWLTLAFDVLFASLFVPLTLGLFWSRFNWQGAAASIVLGAASRIVLEWALIAGVIVEWWVASLGAPVVSLVAGLAATLLAQSR